MKSIGSHLGTLLIVLACTTTTVLGNIPLPIDFFGGIATRFGNAAPTAAPTASPTSADSAICKPDLPDGNYASADCTAVGQCIGGALMEESVTSCNVANGEIFDLDCYINGWLVPPFQHCCTNSDSITCPGPPTLAPTVQHSGVPSTSPSDVPSSYPSDSPTAVHSVTPSAKPSKNPTVEHSDTPSSSPSDVPTAEHSVTPSSQPSANPTVEHTDTPSVQPSFPPSDEPSSSPSDAPSTSPTSAPSSIPTASPTLAPTASPTLPEPAGYEVARTTAVPWAWTRDYANCNNRRLNEDVVPIAAATAEVSKKTNKRSGIRGRANAAASRRRLPVEGDYAEGFLTNWVADSNDALDRYYDDIDPDQFTDRSGEATSGDEGIEEDKQDKDDKDKNTKEKDNANKANNKANDGKECTPVHVIPVGRGTDTITIPQTCPEKTAPFGGPNKVASVRGRYVIPESSGMVASRINPGTIWVHDDYRNHHELHAVNQNTGAVRSYEIRNGHIFDYEDIAIGPGPVPEVDYIYLGDIGDNYARRGSSFNIVTIYRIREPNLGTLQDRDLEYWDKLELIYTDGPHNAEAMIVDPVSERIIIITKSSGTIWVTPEKWGEGNARMTLQKVGKMKTMENRVTGADITPDGKEIVVKYYDAIYYFCLGERSYGDGSDDAWEEIVDVLSKSKGIEVPYNEEPQGEAVCFAHNFDGGIYTLSESTGDYYVPLYHHERL